jgi:thiamine-phosphate pyrophosphorylase
MSLNLNIRSFHLVTRFLRSLEGVYAVLDSSVTADIPELLNAVLRAGVRIIQYRSKSGIDDDVLALLLARAHAENALVIVNDAFDAARKADGLHVGQEDLQRLDPNTLRRRLGRRILGISCSTPEEARAAERIGADYLGVGPFNTTASKADAGACIGIEGLRSIVRATRLPVAAIGGIGLDDLDAVMESGARMAAIISAIALPSDGNSELAARALVQRWQALAL